MMLWTTALALAMQAGGAEACSAGRAPPPPELAGWEQPAPVRAGADAARAMLIRVGTAFDATLLPASGVHYAPVPRKAGEAGSRGGLFTVRVATAGRYRVAMDSAPWVEVVRDGRALEPVSHGHGPACSGVRKMVDFDLAPGRYLLQVTGADRTAVRIMVARLP